MTNEKELLHVVCNVIEFNLFQEIVAPWRFKNLDKKESIVRARGADFQVGVLMRTR